LILPMRALQAAVAAPELRHLQSLVVAQNGQVKHERYFRDRRSTDLSNVHSVTKSVLASIVGIAIERGTLRLETTLGQLLDIEDERKRNISVEQLLTMTSGLEADTPHDIDDIADRGESWVAGPLAAPLRAEPGTTFSYTTAPRTSLVSRSRVRPAHRSRPSQKSISSRRSASTTTAGQRVDDRRR
jgi:CubicO group peptidase (beta-lactamase class C family)